MIPREEVSDRRRRADRIAGSIALLIAAIGFVLLIFPGLTEVGDILEDPYGERKITTTVTKVNGAEGDSPKKTTTDTAQEGGQPTKTTSVEEAGRRTEITTTSTPASLFERSLGAGGLLFLRVGFVALAAFLAGAIVQRILLGHYAIKVAGLELGGLPEVSEASREAILQLQTSIDKQVDLIGNLRQDFDEQAGTIEALGTNTAQALRRLAQLEELVQGISKNSE